jgi:E3 ubiquitin-protein ligase MYCBP2
VDVVIQPCQNHEDGVTMATYFCETCNQHLCGDCDQYAHLKQAKRSHSRKKLETKAPLSIIEQHETCIRFKHSSLLAIIDTTTMKGIVEFKDVEFASNARAVAACRFCGAPASAGSLHGSVCDSVDCLELVRISCTKVLSCSHHCGGVTNETHCLPCLQGCDRPALQRLKINQDHEDQCMICFTSALADEPCVLLRCGHLFHFRCTKSLLDARWNGPRIVFGFAQCPICKTSMLGDTNNCLREALAPIEILYEEVRRKSLMRLDYDGLAKEAGLTVDEQAIFAIRKYAYYVCFKCKKAYFGGDAACEVARDNADFNPSELICGSCVGGLTVVICRFD